MKKNVEKSVTATIAKAMLFILLLCVATTSFAIITLASSLNDAEAVNVAGSMRMQSYRLAHDIQSNSTDYSTHIIQFEHSLYSSSMLSQQSWMVPEDITRDYYQLIHRWHKLKAILTSDNKSQYLIEVANFVNQIDDFVMKLQRFSEQKQIALAIVGSIGLGGVLLIALFVVNFSHEKIVGPLKSLLLASRQIQNRSFDVELSVNSHNELGVLTYAFNQMAKDLGQMYRSLEDVVNEKTRKLQLANQSLQVLYDSSQELSVLRINQENFQAILKHIVNIEGVTAASLEIEDGNGKTSRLDQGIILNDANIHRDPLLLDGRSLGTLYWQYELPCPNKALLDSVSQILSRAIHYSHVQKQTEQLLLMEERATIARELHDSLAQSLSYLKIQMSLLKRVNQQLKHVNLNNEDSTPCHQSHQQYIAKVTPIIHDLDQGLSDAYTQLRELLTTFRLTIKEGNLDQALKEMLEQLNKQTTATIMLDNHLSSLNLNAHQQVHLLQLIREAVINAIKHAEATQINVFCKEIDHQMVVKIKDNGKGFDPQERKLNHYGLNIMHERAERLGAQLTVTSSPNMGCDITLTYESSKENDDDNV